MDKPIEKLYNCIESVFDHYGVKGYTLYICSNYIDLRLIKLVEYIIEHKEIVNNNSRMVHKQLADAIDEFIDYMEDKDNQYFIPSSGWYTLQCSKKDLRAISEWFRI